MHGVFAAVDGRKNTGHQHKLHSVKTILCTSIGMQLAQGHHLNADLALVLYLHLVATSHSCTSAQDGLETARASCTRGIFHHHNSHLCLLEHTVTP